MPATISQPPATTTTGLTILYGWEYSTTSRNSGYAPLAATSQDLPVPAHADTYYFKRIAYLSGTSPTGAPVVLQQCESNAVQVVIVSPSFVVANSAVSADVCSGAGTSFSVRVFSMGAVTRQWQEDNGSGFADIFSGSPYSGVNSSTLTISNAVGLGDKRFRCTVTSTVNADCQSRSVTFSLHERPAPVVTPLAQTVCERVTPTGSTAIINLSSLNNALTASDPSSLSVSWFTSSPRTSISDPANFQFTGTTVLSANVNNTSTNCATDAAVTLTTKSFPTATATLRSPSNLCYGEYFDVALQGADQYQWTVAAPTEIQGAAAGQGVAIHQALTNSGSQHKTVTYTILPTQNGCTGPPLDVTATVEPEVKKFAVTGGGAICLGNVGVTIGLVNSQPNMDYELEQDGQSTGITLTSPGGPFVYPNPVASDGTFTIHATVDGLCETDMDGNAIVTVRTVPQGTGLISGDNIVCLGSTHIYETSGWTDATDYQWILPTQMRSVREEERVAEIVAEQGGEAGAVQLQAIGTNPCGAGTTATKIISIHNNPVVAIEEPQVVVAGQPFNLVYNTTAPLMQWQWNFGDGGASTGQYPEHTYDQPGPYVVSLNAVDENNCSGSSTLDVVVTTAISSNNIKNVITANGDSQNGYLIVEDLEKFPDNEVVLLTRWGNEVFRKKGYANDWDARIDGYFLPAGNYVCIVRLTETNNVFSRVVTVVKD
ncbi:MAG TPA: gliding motility-associated C-terminal domain-containing protein [Chryseolinea sp.]